MLLCIKYNNNYIKFNTEMELESSIRIYDWAMIKGNHKTLHELREEKMLYLENEI